jgi:hypothetical protein
LTTRYWGFKIFWELRKNPENDIATEEQRAQEIRDKNQLAFIPQPPALHNPNRMGLSFLLPFLKLPSLRGSAPSGANDLLTFSFIPISR